MWGRAGKVGAVVFVGALATVVLTSPRTGASVPSITGNVTAASGGAPLAGICVRGVQNGGAANSGTVTASDGSYSLGQLPTGNYTVSFFAGPQCSSNTGNYARQFYNNAPNEQAATPVALTTGQTTANIDAAMVVGGSITGTVTAANGGGGLQGVCVVTTLPGASWFNFVFTAADGTYDVDGLNTGNYSVEFSPMTGCGNHDDVPQWYSGKSSASTADLVAVSAGQGVSGINAALTPRFSTTTAVQASPSSSSFGQPVTYGATVVSSSGTPTGSVSFTIGPMTLCTASLSNGNGSCNATNAPVGSNTVKGTYSGDPTFLGSSGTTSTAVSKDASQISVGGSPNPGIEGQAIQLTATVSGTTAGSGIPSGTVSFSADGAPVTSCSGANAVALDSTTGAARCSVTYAGSGSHSIVASYSGDINHSSSTSPPLHEQVAPPPQPPPPPSPSTSPAGSHSGYDLVGSDGGVFVFPQGQSGGFYGSLPGLGVHVNNIVGMVPSPDDKGYFLVGSDGGVFAFGDAPFLGSLPGLGVRVNNIRGIVPTSDNRGYFLVGSDGGVFAFGDAPFLGSLPSEGVHRNDVVGIAANPSDQGYWVVARDGTVYGFGNAQQLGSAFGTPSPVSGISSTPDGGGYWIVTQNGGTYTFGDAGSFGSLPSIGVTPSRPVIGLVPTADDQGYWLIGSDGGIFAFGDAPFVGSLPGLGVNISNVVGAVPTKA